MVDGRLSRPSQIHSRLLAGLPAMPQCDFGNSCRSTRTVSGLAPSDSTRACVTAAIARAFLSSSRPSIKWMIAMGIGLLHNAERAPSEVLHFAFDVKSWLECF